MASNDTWDKEKREKWETFAAGIGITVLVCIAGLIFLLLLSVGVRFIAYAQDKLDIVIVAKGTQLNLFKASLVGGIYAVLGTSSGWISAYLMFRRKRKP